MKISIALLAVALCAWGWLLKTWLATAVLLLSIAISQLSQWRWQITQQQFHRWGDLTMLLIIGLLLYGYQHQQDGLPIFRVLKWLPLLFAPVLLTQLFSSQQQIPLGTLFYSFRRRLQPATTLDFTLPYTGLVLLSAGAANVQDNRYFVIVSVLFSVILWRYKPRQSATIACWLLISIALIGSYYGQQQLRQLQNLVEEKAIAWLSERDNDFFKTQTSIGDIGALKLSDKIILRVQSNAPLRLLQASYDRYLGQSWLASQATFQTKKSNSSITSAKWQHITLLQTFQHKNELLALPMGKVEIKGLEGAVLQYNGLGTVKISEPPPFAAYQVAFTGQKIDPPSSFDVQIPKRHVDWLKAMTTQLRLAQHSPEEIATKIQAHFQQHFRYSLYLGTETDSDSALRDFILRRKAGHCEYFAVASVFLLRQMGIPARLANGYVVEEYDAQQGLYQVRQRHAHAWAIAYINGSWRDVDSTPAQWLALENAQQPWFSAAQDFFSNLGFHFDQWRLQQNQQQQTIYWLSAALLLAIYIGWRIYSAKSQLSRQKILKTALPATVCLGQSSEFYNIIQYLENTELAKQSSESVQQWVCRLQNPVLIELYQWHYQLRFDPLGLPAASRVQLQQQVKQWLAAQRLKKSS